MSINLFYYQHDWDQGIENFVIPKRITVENVWTSLDTKLFPCSPGDVELFSSRRRPTSWIGSYLMFLVFWSKLYDLVWLLIHQILIYAPIPIEDIKPYFSQFTHFMVIRRWHQHWLARTSNACLLHLEPILWRGNEFLHSYSLRWRERGVIRVLNFRIILTENILEKSINHGRERNSTLFES